MSADSLPLDRFPQIEFFSGESVTPTVVTLPRSPNCDPENVTLLAEERNVTAATVTLRPAPLSVTAATVTFHAAPEVPHCIMCGVELGRSRWDRRADIKTCSDRCRKAASRRNAAIKREVQHVQDALNTLERYSDRWPDLFQDIMRAIGQCAGAAGTTSRKVAPKGDNR